MDGFMCDSDVKLIKRLSCRIDGPAIHTFTFCNTFQPFTDNTIKVKPYWHTKNQLVLNDVITKLNDGLRVVVSVTSANVAEFLATEISKLTKSDG